MTRLVPDASSRTVFGPTVAFSVVVATTALLLWGLFSGPTIPDALWTVDESEGDIALYRAVGDRMDEGEGYYSATIAEQVARHYPTSPAFAVRTPVLLTAMDVIGEPAMLWILRALVAVACLLALIRFDRMTRRLSGPTWARRLEWYGATLAFAAGIGMFTSSKAAPDQDPWAAVLIALSLLTWNRRRPELAMLLALAAALIRELALIHLVAMAVCAVLTRSRRECAGWGLALLAFAAAYALHWWTASGLTPDSAASSPGWAVFGGWPHLVEMFRFSTALQYLPFWAGAVATPLALLGVMTLPGPWGRRVTASVVLFMAVFAVFGRVDNVYWGWLYSAWLFTGIVFIPRAAVGLMSSFHRGRGSGSRSVIGSSGREQRGKGQ